jgi:serine/threonine protein kinase
VSDEKVTHLVRVWACSSSWILMDFIDGPNLREYLAERPARRSVRFGLLEKLGPALFRAMDDLDRCQFRHGDLSPSNIILQTGPDGTVSFKLIDLGINYLYSHTVAGQDGPDSLFVAPEVRSGATSRVTDLFSLGQLLIAIGAGSPSRDLTVPDMFYADSPIMARFLEDLVDLNPVNRLLMQPELRLLLGRPRSPDNPDQQLYPRLATLFQEEREAADAARRYGISPTDGSFLATIRSGIAVVRETFTPLAGAPYRLSQLW